LLTKYLKPTTDNIIKIKRNNPPDDLTNSLIDIITAVGVGKSSFIPILSYILTKVGTTFINMKTVTMIAT
jgi:hypothetical protein